MLIVKTIRTKTLFIGEDYTQLFGYTSAIDRSYEDKNGGLYSFNLATGKISLLALSKIYKEIDNLLTYMEILDFLPNDTLVISLNYDDSYFVLSPTGEPLDPEEGWNIFWLSLSDY